MLTGTHTLLCKSFLSNTKEAEEPLNINTQGEKDGVCSSSAARRKYTSLRNGNRRTLQSFPPSTCGFNVAQPIWQKTWKTSFTIPAEGKSRSLSVQTWHIQSPPFLAVEIALSAFPATYFHADYPALLYNHISAETSISQKR